MTLNQSIRLRLTYQMKQMNIVTKERWIVVQMKLIVSAIKYRLPYYYSIVIPIVQQLDIGLVGRLGKCWWVICLLTIHAEIMTLSF